MYIEPFCYGTDIPGDRDWTPWRGGDIGKDIIIAAIRDQSDIPNGPKLVPEIHRAGHDKVSSLQQRKFRWVHSNRRFVIEPLMVIHAVIADPSPRNLFRERCPVGMVQYNNGAFYLHVFHELLERCHISVPRSRTHGIAVDIINSKASRTKPTHMYMLLKLPRNAIRLFSHEWNSGEIEYPIATPSEMQSQVLWTLVSVVPVD